MILDSLNGLERYLFLHDRFPKAYKYLKSVDLSNIEDGRYELDGNDLFVSITTSNGKSPEDATLEAHDSYIDIQVLIDGEETMGWKDRAQCNSDNFTYDENKDLILFNSDVPTSYFTMQNLHAVIFFPHDAHAPMIGNGIIKKAVVKVKL